MSVDTIQILPQTVQFNQLPVEQQEAQKPQSSNTLGASIRSIGLSSIEFASYAFIGTLGQLVYYCPSYLEKTYCALENRNNLVISNMLLVAGFSAGVDISRIAQKRLGVEPSPLINVLTGLAVAALIDNNLGTKEVIITDLLSRVAVPTVIGISLASLFALKIDSE